MITQGMVASHKQTRMACSRLRRGPGEIFLIGNMIESSASRASTGARMDVEGKANWMQLRQDSINGS